MKINVNYQQNNILSEGQIEVTVSAKQLSDDVQKLVNSISDLDNHFGVVPLSINDKVIMVPTEEIIAIEVYENELTVYTITDNYQLKGKLKTMLQRLTNDDFLQISKNAIINLNYLLSLEASFSGNMTAFLKNNLKMTVSRKYLSELKENLGM
ncbi:LytTR family DNA-binding domain-containing protein [Companilactobacillus sp.]|jgi:DNA-binding LytR/AlgR family response regulator|uniref:LytTR family DNA-binding domain-containing protein n=1 Tax=Companilactobacillus sp. TaxID=2767905 RepID=UPI0025C1F4E5|nr:LytTR family DNA-binding domain-containing protein [Companilactobacillus sp.]MCH4009422.1 LytTR family transcriptional regulator [Companilactobacillus sp.]MCH4050399.1 LytTR family transcriptional regulator [Companilactobacillus sp.]MCH4077364.1 LytTR family transcriptional regulator [Companilactobacillus sp.]MCH4125940.1 LytTR family transcriptional regulator [Companilactobacillus sp.]MCI1311649.1 LytTR family transcriptional regulator [Companilactobacillus sp.]